VPDGYNHREALFGISPYGGSIQAKVYYADDTLCGQRDVDKSKAYPRGDASDTWESPFILMVDRGECTFVQKVRNGQHAGAAGVLIADTTCLCGDTDCIPSELDSSCETQEPIMADDGSGGDISIPSFLLFKRDADKFKAVLMQNRPVQVDMSWAMPQPDGHVEYDLWTTPFDIVSRSFLSSWKTVAVALGDRAYFTPHMFIYDGVRAGCLGTSGGSNCFNLCTNAGRYCGTDPDDDLGQGVSGADVVRESLRRLCIWNTFGAPNGIGTQWWDYVNEHNEKCTTTSNLFADDKCIGEVYKKVGIDASRIDRCMADSGSTSQDVTNNKLENEIAAQTRRGVIILPSAFVNTAPIRGALNVNNIFTAICSGFAAGTAPDVCTKCSSCSDVVGCIDHKMVCQSSSSMSYSSSRSNSSSMSFGAFFMWMLVLIGALAGAATLYYKRSQDEMRSHVRDILAEYMPLQDDNNDSPRIPLASSGFNLNGHPNNGNNYAMTSLIS
jgi:PA domain